MQGSQSGAVEKAPRKPLRYTRQTRLDDFLEAQGTAQKQKRAEAEDKKTEAPQKRRTDPCAFDAESYRARLSSIEFPDPRYKLAAEYPLMGSTTPWHSVGVLRFFDDLDKIIRAKGLKPLSNNDRYNILSFLTSAGLAKVVDGQVINFLGCV